MILGIGSDLADIRRIAAALARFGARFEERCFTPVELAKAAGRAERAATLAKRFAAKEACSKALGTGLRQAACSGATWAWSTLSSGATNALTADRRRRPPIWRAITPPGCVAAVIDLTHDRRASLMLKPSSSSRRCRSKEDPR